MGRVRPWLAVLVILAAGVVCGQPAPDVFFERFDANKDGKVSRDEFPENARDRFARFDPDSDGFVTRAEYENLVERGRRQRARRNRQPARTPTHAGVRYGPDERNVLDLYLAPGEGPHPLVMFFHGGGFRGGDKSRINPLLLDLLHEKGISYGAANYRLTKTAPFPAAMHDAARAIQFVRLHAAEYGIDPKRIGATGGSAGAGISLWLAYHDDMADPKSDDRVLRQSSRLSVAAVTAGQSTYDPRVISKMFSTTKMHTALKPFYGMAEDDRIDDPKFFDLYREASPVSHLTKDDPPVLLYYSQPDTPLPPDSTGRQHIHHPMFGHYLKERTDKVGTVCEVRLKTDWKTQGEMSRGLAEFFAKYLLDPQ